MVKNGACKPESNFDFSTMYFCEFQKFGKIGKRFVFWIVGGFLMYLGMYILATTADHYLSPCLEFITQKFGISESLAGVTLLAFGNGAPDVFQGIAAAKSNDP